jgi:hypothetical protein
MGDLLAVCDETKPSADRPDPRKRTPTECEIEIEMLAVVADLPAVLPISSHTVDRNEPSEPRGV